MPKVAALFAKETDINLEVHASEVSVHKVTALFAEEESDSELVQEEWKEFDSGLIDKETQVGELTKLEKKQEFGLLTGAIEFRTTD